MTPPVTTSYPVGYPSQSTTTASYTPYPSVHPVPQQQQPSQHGFAQAPQPQRVEHSQVQNGSPSMAHMSHHAPHHAQHPHQQQHAPQRPPVTYSMSYPQQVPPTASYHSYSTMSQEYRRADPTSGGLPSMRTLDHPMGGHIGHQHSMMMMQPPPEMGYYPHMMAGHYMNADMLARYPLDARYNIGRNPKKEIKRRTKTGCMTCRKRRIKCDEAHPTCNNCKKSKRDCLGYDPIFKQNQNQAPGQNTTAHPTSSQAASSSPSQVHAHHSPALQKSQPSQLGQQTDHSPHLHNVLIKSESSQLPPLTPSPTQASQSVVRPPSQTQTQGTSSLATSGILSSAPVAHQGYNKPTTPVASSYPTPTPTASSCSYDNGMNSNSPPQSNGYEYHSSSIDPALGGTSQMRPMYADHSHQARMPDHLPQIRHVESASLLWGSS